MKKTAMLLCVAALCLFSVSCSKDVNKDDGKNGTVTFGANYDVINCITTVTIFIDGQNIGKLTNATDTITECGHPGNVTKRLPVGEHSYKVEIRPALGSGCSKDITGTVQIKENECTKVFINYFKVM